MAYEQRENSGILFRNDRKEPGSKQPDWKGTVNVNGVTLEIAAWERQGKKGMFLSLAISEPRGSREPF